jgi:cytochrome c oxidase cbb3-type subunit 3
MSLRCSELAIVVMALGLLTSCGREQRKLEDSWGSAPAKQSAGLSGVAEDSQPSRTAQGPRFEQQAYEVSQGQRLFEWFNCSGCHSSGGGGSIGPALMDDQWIYGSAPENIHETVVQGRPNGMPSFGSRITDRQAWQLVAYVRSLSGLAPDTVASARRDSMYTRPRPQSLPDARPRSGSPPPSTQQ